MKNFNKKSISLMLVFTMLIAIFMPSIAHAETYNNNYNQTQTSNEQVLNSINMNDYINGKKAEFETALANAGVNTSLSSNIDYNTLFSAQEGNCKYALAGNIDFIWINNVKVYTIPYTTVNVTTIPPIDPYENININSTFTNTEGEIVINNERTPEGPGYNGTLNNAGYTDSNKNNTITINTSFSMNYAKKITINGTDYACNGTESNVYVVPGAASYTINIEGDSSSVTPKTIIWANPDYVPKDAADAQWVKDFTLGHGYARAIEVYDPNNHKLSPNDYINTIVQPDGSQSDEYGINNGFGWVKILPGSRVVFEFTPEYGYQLTSISINEQPINATATMNKFEFTMPDGSGNIHFAATFTKTEDIVKTDSEKVSEGGIKLGNNLAGGSAQLTVKDVQLSADKIKGFEGAAEGYTVSNYLDIDLYNVFYKGKADSNDVWSNKITELDKEATISLKLADGITADDIVIVHNIHDGEEYEIIEIDSYDPETNTITFRTKSFSNYAIATKTSSTVEETNTQLLTKNPKTGDNIILTILIFAIATLGTCITIKSNKNHKVRKH